MELLRLDALAHWAGLVVLTSLPGGFAFCRPAGVAFVFQLTEDVSGYLAHPVLIFEKRAVATPYNFLDAKVEFGCHNGD